MSYYIEDGMVFDSDTGEEQLTEWADMTIEQIDTIIERNISIGTERSIEQAAIMIDSDGNPTDRLIDLIKELIQLRKLIADLGSLLPGY